MAYILLVGVAISFVELAIYYKLIGHGRIIFDWYKKIFNIIYSSSISDHWKEKVLPLYAKYLMKKSIKIFFILLITCSPALVAVMLTRVFYPEFQTLLYSWKGIISMTMFAVIYINIRRYVFG